MKARDISIGRHTELAIKQAGDISFGTVLEPSAYAELWRLDLLDEITLSVGKNQWPVVGLDATHQRNLEELVSRRLPRICILAAATPPRQATQRVVLSVWEFGQEFNLGTETIDIAVTDAAFEDLKKLTANADLLRWLEEELVLSDARSPAIIITGQGDSLSTRPDGFRLYGRSIAVDVKRVVSNYEIRRVIKHRHVTTEAATALVYATVRFHDASAAAAFKDQGTQVLDAIVSQANGSYLRIWQEYNELERQEFLQRARAIGAIRYDGKEQWDDGWRLSIKTEHKKFIKWWEQLNNNGEEVILEISESLPSELDPNLELDPDTDDWPIPEDWQQRLVVYCEEDIRTAGKLFVRPCNPDEERKPPATGYIYPSLIGDLVRVTRRQAAWEKIRNGETPIPGLGLLLENSEQFTARGYRRRTIDRREIRRAFDGTPTEKQYRAIEIAINTPDIALIQGPPGTGKTRVIAALNRLIADERFNERYGFGKTLLTSYQHDAVEHVASVARTFGLPAVKVGRRSRVDSSFDPVDSWRQEKVRELEHAALQVAVTPVGVLYRRAQQLLNGYIKAPSSRHETVRNLRTIHGDAAIYLAPSTREELFNVIRQLEKADVPRTMDTRLLEKFVRALRTDEVSFKDDGPKNAYKLLLQLRESPLVTNSDTKLLEAASSWIADETPGFLNDLEALRNRLLDALDQPRQLDQAELVNADVEQILTKIVNELHEKLHNAPGSTELFVWRFKHDLESDPDGTREAIAHYSALAATCQQSVGRQMERVFDDDEIVYGTVIVDEAARSNPLDLLIPIVRSRRRIILVGDHRQLPHMLEAKIERELERSSEAAREVLSRSLFERLFVWLKSHHDVERVVTLDQQFRMHPVLGQFVSDTFYAPHGEGFWSPLPAEQFEHNIATYQRKVAVWQSIPSSLGQEQGSQSKRRPAEAKRIAEEAKRILDGYPDLSVGVITFYTAQVHAILQEMHGLGIVKETENGYQIVGSYAEKDGHERLRVGTVDAFQGKEFDVVLLSMTRSNNLVAKPGDKVAQRQKFGFLTLENRLCVAMSRQRRLLIVFGDDEMIHCPAAREAIPGLVAFYELCGGEHGVRIPA